MNLFDKNNINLIDKHETKSIKNNSILKTVLTNHIFIPKITFNITNMNLLNARYLEYKKECFRLFYEFFKYNLFKEFLINEL